MAKEWARRSNCLNNLKQIGTAFELHCQEYDNDYAAPFWLGQLCPQYIKDARLFICLSDLGVHEGKLRPPDDGHAWEVMKGIPSGSSCMYYPRVGVLWYSWPEMYDYEMGDLPVAACHIHMLNGTYCWQYSARQDPILRRNSILILCRDSHIATADKWQEVRMGPRARH